MLLFKPRLYERGDNDFIYVVTGPDHSKSEVVEMLCRGLALVFKPRLDERGDDERGDNLHDGAPIFNLCKT